MSATPSASHGPSASEQVSLWSEAGTIYRRICVMRNRGRSVEAAQLQSTALSAAIGAIRQTAAGPAECESRLNALFALEEERVANASVLAEILFPLLRDLVADAAPRVRAASPEAPAGAVAVPARRPRATAPAIADFIDEMLQQERSAGASAP